MDFHPTPRAWIAAVVLLLASLGFYSYSRPRNVVDSSKIQMGAELSLDDPTLDEIAKVVEMARSQPGLDLLPEQAPAAWRQHRSPLWVEWREAGRKVADGWYGRGNWAENLTDALNSFGGLFSRAESVCIFLTTARHPLDLKTVDWERLDLQRGLVGIEFRYGGVHQLYSPIDMWVNQLSFRNAHDRFLRSQGQDPRATLRRKLEVNLLQGRQLLVILGDRPRTLEMTRLNTPEPDYLSREEVLDLRDRLADYMVRELEPDGQFPYLYLPTQDRTSQRRELVIRQALGSWAVGLWAAGHPSALEPHRANLRQTLLTHYRTDGQVGMLAESIDRPPSLGGIGLLGLAVSESPIAAEFVGIHRSLLAASDQMWRADGGFVTQWGSEDKKTGINFYPGEGLLYWASELERRPDPARLQRFMKSFRFYREHFQQVDERRAAFVPWQAQAYLRVYRLTKDPELLDFSFEMCDWLLQMVLWEKAEFADHKGMFWDPERPEQARVPHVTSTGVYLEGLSLAFEVAREVGDQEREERYRLALLRGLRSLRVHQLRDSVDLFACPDPERVRGALRSQPHSADIRVDNGAHALLALMRITRTFKESDYRPPPAP